ncbi:MAG: hypothetical protein QXQ61_02540 [Candidatus Bathyarchaeia archaeon]
MKVESAIVVVIAICIFLSFYFSLLSLMTNEEMMKQQFVLLAVYSLLSGIVVFGCLMIYIVIRKIFEKTALNLVEPHQLDFRAAS